ncbi:hypothetical protein GCM10027286_08960 [Virgibacillus ainsalahensis]
MVGAITRCGNTLRFPRAAGEPPRARRVARLFRDATLLAEKIAIALRGLTDASSPAGVFVYFLRWLDDLQLHQKTYIA